MDSILQHSSSLPTSDERVASSQGLNHPRVTREERARLRLLIVEDNKVNQVVALGILENLGYQADVAADGRDALGALGRKDYDLILMDCQMPEMDGYEAARLIRQRDTAGRNHDIPIIAVTAHALAGDRELCLAAGMNDYISKPLRTDLLDQTIEQWTAGARAGSERMTPPAELAAAGGSKLFDSGDFTDRLMGNQQLAQRIVRGFIDDMPRQIALLARAVNDGDAGQVRLVAHSIKGAASSVCGLEVQEVARNLEQMGRAGDLTATDAALLELSASFARVRPMMERFSRPELDSDR